MYASSPGLNGMEHPLYDVWVISCNTNAAGPPPRRRMASTAPVKVRRRIPPTRKQTGTLPEEAGK